MVVGDKMFGVVSYVIVGGGAGVILPEGKFCIFPPPGLRFCAFSETDFWIYSVTLHLDKLN
jgi:hypothetical protein